MLTAFPLPILAEPATFSTFEKMLFLALAVASGWAFWRRFSFVLKRILASKPDPGFHLTKIGKRSWDFFWEVLCQAKVIRERPLPGLAHAFVFWAFGAFVLVTLNHSAVVLGLGFLSPSGVFGQFYFDLAALFALACAVSILSLFIRRFLLRPIWLGPDLSWESGLIALLIFLLMATYLAGFFVSPTDPTARALWWAHTLCLLAFLPLIPHTKHLHLVLSPATIFLSRGSFASIPPLSGDEDFGLVAGTDLTRLVSLQAYSCVECGRCTEHCPASATGKVLNPKEIILGLRSYLNELGPASTEPLLGKYNSQEAVFQCTTCGACEFQCPVGIEHVPILVGLRRGAVNTGAWDDTHGSKLFLNLERGSNALGLSSTDRDRFIEKQALPIFDGSQEYCLWLGCMGGYDPKGREIIADFARVMRYLGTSFGVLRKEKCTGDPVRRLGNDLLFQQLAESNLETLAQNKVKKIVTICPHCVRTIQEDWKEYGTPPEVEHHSEFMARFADKLPHRDSNGNDRGGIGLKGTGFSPYEQPPPDSGGALAPEGRSPNAADPEPASLVSGHDFSRAKEAEISTRALAPEISRAKYNESGHDFSRANQAANLPGASAPATGAEGYGLQPVHLSQPKLEGALAPATGAEGYGLQPVHLSQPKLEGALAPEGPEKIVFHDPCYLGRYRNIYDEPRTIVAQSGQLVEAPRNHERSFCCGAGGGLAFLGEESGQRVSQNRIQELIATGATTIAAACPFCNTMLNDALAATGDAAPQLVDIAQLAARNLPDYHRQESK